jgi:hypothetical protein
MEGRIDKGLGQFTAITTDDRQQFIKMVSQLRSRQQRLIFQNR